MTRNIPKKVREALRKEVNFGCPIDGCGSPYLSYHHFDPPWHIENHHRPEGMIALCLEHHKQADYNAFTDDQLKEFKKNPFLSSDDSIQGQINWKRENLVFLIGGNVFIGAQNIYLNKQEQLLWLTTDEQGNSLLNLDMKSEKGELIFSLRDNDWLVMSNFDNIESIPSGKKLFFENKTEDLKIDIEFNNYSKVDFQKKYAEDIPARWIEIITNKIVAEPITVCVINGHLTYPFEIRMESTGTTINGEGSEITVMGSLTLKNVKEHIMQRGLVVGSGVLIK
ncbi:hypothetical protein [Kordia sp.]|uniref:hypothetical protein n=1 Tax=Kordia sp. TaxID=1965332 RepID=UPI003D2BA32F